MAIPAETIVKPYPTIDKIKFSLLHFFKRSEKPDKGLHYTKEAVNGPIQELDIRNLEDIKKAVRIIGKQRPFAFAGNFVYGIGGSPEVFQRDIARMKDRNFQENPPVAIPSWRKFKEFVDWERLAGDHINPNQLIEHFGELYQILLIHTILPIKKAAKTSLLFPKEVSLDNGEKVLTQAMMLSGASPHLQNLIGEFEAQTGAVFHATSANRKGETTCVTAEEIAKTFPEIPVVLKDPDLDQRVENRCSYTMFDLTNFPDKVVILRLGNTWPLLNPFVLNGIKPPLDFSLLELDHILTPAPEVIRLK